MCSFRQGKNWNIFRDLDSNLFVDDLDEAFYFDIFFKIRFLFWNLFPDSIRDEVQFVRSKFGNALLMDKTGYLYQKSGGNQAKTKIYWKCLNNVKFKCRARANIEGFYITGYHGSHHPSCAPSDKEKNWNIGSNQFLFFCRFFRWSWIYTKLKRWGSTCG